MPSLMRHQGDLHNYSNKMQCRDNVKFYEFKMLKKFKYKQLDYFQSSTWCRHLNKCFIAPPWSVKWFARWFCSCRASREKYASCCCSSGLVADASLPLLSQLGHIEGDPMRRGAFPVTFVHFISEWPRPFLPPHPALALGPPRCPTPPAVRRRRLCVLPPLSAAPWARRGATDCLLGLYEGF